MPLHNLKSTPNLKVQQMLSRESGAVGASPQQYADLEAAAATAREAAAAFGEETSHFMDCWLDKVLGGESGSAEMPLHIIDECLVDDSERCQALEDAIKQVRNAAGNWTGLNG